MKGWRGRLEETEERMRDPVYHNTYKTEEEVGKGDNTVSIL